MTSWEFICEKLEEDASSPLITTLKPFIGEAQDLALISINDIEEIANRGLINERTKSLLYNYLNSWEIIFYRMMLSKDAIQTCKSLFRVPSDALYMNQEVELENFSTAAYRALLSCLDDLLSPKKWERLNTMEDLEGDEKTKDEQARNRAQKLFSTITIPEDKDCCISSDIVVDDKYENYASGYICARQLLALASETVKVIDSSIGTVENLGTIIQVIVRFNHLQLVDFRDNRLDQSQWNDIVCILSLVSKNQGVLIIYGNPVCKCRELFQQLCIVNEADFLRLMWIPEKDLNRRYISNEYKQKTVFYAHIAFYELMSKFHRAPNFYTKKFSKLRFFKQ